MAKPTMAAVPGLKDTYVQLKTRMDKAVDDFRKALVATRTGRASVNMLDGVSVEAYGARMPLNQVAQVHAPEPQLITVQPFDPSQLSAIEKSIRAAELGLNPMNDGKIIRVPVPPLTEERRKEMVKHLHKVLEDHRTAVRNIRRDGNDAIKKALKDKKITEDEEKRSMDEIQKLTDGEIKKMEDMCKAKEKEVMEIRREATAAGIIPQQWQKFFQEGIQSKIPDKVGSNIYAVYFDYASDHNGEYTYLIGAMVKDGTAPPAGMVAKRIPAGQYAVLTTDKGPLPQVVPGTWQKIFKLEDDRNLKRAYQADFEIFDQRAQDPQNAELDIYVGVK